MHDPLLLRMLDLKTGRGRLVMNSLQNAPQAKFAILLLQYLGALLVFFFPMQEPVSWLKQEIPCSTTYHARYQSTNYSNKLWR